MCVGKRDRLTRRQRWESWTRTSRTTRSSSTARWWPSTRSAPSSAPSATGCRWISSPAARIVPKTLVFAKDDSHAEDIVRIIREEFGKGDEFCQKITYKVSGRSPKT